MASLDPSQYQLPSSTMLNLGPAGELGESGLYGDAYLDAETVAAFLEAARVGTFGLNPDWMPAIVDTDDAELEELFVAKLRATRLGRTAPVLHHRRLALYEAIRELGEPGTVPGFGLSVHNLSRCIGDVETWLEGKRQELAGRGLTDEQLVRMLAMVPTNQLAALLAVTPMTLSRWRGDNAGPRYVQSGPRTIMYPAVAVLEWLQERMSA